MKTLSFKLLLALLFVLPLSVLNAQDDGPQAFWVHEDVVKPGMVGEYETVCKDLTSNMEKYNIQEMNVIVTNTADNRYLWVSPIENMADIDRPVFKTLAEKMGAEKMGALFDKMDKCYDIEHNYVLYLNKELTYMPDGITQTPEGQDYRKFHYYHYTPGNQAAVVEKAKAIKELFKSKGSKLDYRVYQSGFGNRGAYYMVAIAAKDAADYANKLQENNEHMGEEWPKTLNAFMATLLRYEAVEGQMRPDMGYAPN